MSIDYVTAGFCQFCEVLGLHEVVRVDAQGVSYLGQVDVAVDLFDPLEHWL